MNGEEPLSTLPTWSSLYVTLGNATYSPATPAAEISHYVQSMSIEDGVVTTSLTWTPQGLAAVNLTYQTFAHQAMRNLGVLQLNVTGAVAGTPLTITDLLDVSDFIPTYSAYDALTQ